MTLFLDSADIKALATDEICGQAAWAAVEAESIGRTQLPPRIDVPSGNGFLRVMPAVLGPVMGLKVMTLAEGIGNRYLVLLYDSATGELRGALDADELTRLRTAAFTATAAKLMVSDSPATLAVIGSGFEADGHLRALCQLWSFESVTVFSPSPARREAFVARQAAELGIKISAGPERRRGRHRRGARHDRYQVQGAGPGRQPARLRSSGAVGWLHAAKPARTRRRHHAPQRNAGGR